MSAPARKRVSLSQIADNHGTRWQQAMREAITDVDTLFAILDLPAEALPAARRSADLFPLRVPRGYVDRMARGDLLDPLLRQILPMGAESDPALGFEIDAVGDAASELGDGVLHKYAGRVLLVTTGACAVHCRYCFRRHYDYANHHAGGDRSRAAIARIAADASIKEVILSGGDPLSLSNERLNALGEQLDAIAHVTRLRLHTRTAVVLPERIDNGFVDWIASRRQQVVIVIHANHAREIDAGLAAALARLRSSGATLFNQSVLLKGVNDDAETLAALSERLFAVGVMPYYLHLLDRVAGTAHFEVDPARAQQLMDALAGRVAGYLVPRLARENAGEGAKRVFGHRADG